MQANVILNREKEHEFVDLGLSVKWATYNVGATSPEEYGKCYAWGEVKSKTDYSWETYDCCNGSFLLLTKYCTHSSFNKTKVDKKTTLEAMEDAATYNWGGRWRMPTDAEWKELKCNCIWVWTTRNGVNGYEVRSKTNGKSIFLPAAGAYYDTNLIDVGLYGYYWSSSLSLYDDSRAWGVRFDSGRVYRYYYNRYYGQFVRPVLP